ncbi:MAG: CHAT domain-containing protein [Candidatus Magnetomorum sp.]|nr:CHAT domain-containing protein [Candidatus Magnetomorum sp.]
MTLEINDLLKEAIQRDLELDTIVSQTPEKYVRQKKQKEKRKKDAFQKAIDEFIKGKDYEHLLLAMKLSGDKSIKCPLIDGNKDLVSDTLKQYHQKAEQKEISILVNKADKIYQKAVSEDREIPFKCKNNWLELVIRILMELLKRKSDSRWLYNDIVSSSNVYYLLADAYFKRGKCILPKGKGVSAPEKKLEAMKKSLGWCCSYFDEAAEGDGSYRLKFTELYVQVLHELYRMDLITYQNDFHDALKKFMKMSITPQTPLQFYILSLYCSELTPNNEDLDRTILSMPIDFEMDRLTADYPGLMLAKLQSVFRLVKTGSMDNDDFNNEIKVFISIFKDQKHTELFSPIWDDLILFIKMLCTEKYPQWKELALEAWNICNNKEQLMSFGLQIRQYWSRLDDLYHLAIKAAISTENLQKAAEIIDSLKGRSQITWADMDSFLLKRKDTKSEAIKTLREHYYQMEAHAAMGIYNPEYTILRKQLPSKIKGKSPVAIDQIPAAFTSIHLYIDETMNGHAICGHQPENSNDVKWKKYEFNAKPVWQSYKHWKDTCTSKKETWDALNDLCKTLGKSMSFLFEISKSAKGIIFIPHGFMHQLPLHAAFDSTEPPLFCLTCCTYLPAWSLAFENMIHQDLKGKYILRHFDDRKYIEETQQTYDHEKWTNRKDDISRDDMISQDDWINNKQIPPDILCILCHGKADKVNPFDSKLKIKNGGLSCLDLQMTSLNIEGTTIILGACETELSPAYNSMIDEHISIAGIFLTKKAKWVVGSFWECSAALTSEMIVQIISDESKNSLSLLEKFQTIQHSWFNTRKSFCDQNGEPTDRLYYFAPFKIIGYPG